jgi:hypothetical protein
MNNEHEHRLPAYLQDASEVWSTRKQLYLEAERHGRAAVNASPTYSISYREACIETVQMINCFPWAAYILGGGRNAAVGWQW